MKVPTVEVEWVPDSPRTLVVITLRVGKEEKTCGCGGTLAVAFDDLARSIRLRAEYIDDNRMRELLEDKK